MSFWKFNFKQTSAIDTLVEQEGTTLTQVLDEDDVIQECKVQNKRLINFIIQPANLEELVKMVCQEPPPAEDEKTRFKYPHLACEILTSETKDSFTILEQLCGEDRYQNMLWAFLDEKEPLNPLIGSFISKVLSVLLAHKCNSVMQFILAKEDFLPSFLAHLNTSAFTDLLLQMFAAPDTDQARLDLAMWLNNNAVVELLINKIHVEEDEDLCVNVAQLLGDIVRIGREWHQMSLPSPIITRLEEKETVERLLLNMLDTPEQSDVVIVSGISVLLSLMETRRQPNPFEPQTPVEEYTAGLLCALGPLTERVGVVRELLERPPKAGSQMLNTTGTLDPPLGNTRLQVMKLFVAMISAGSSELNAKIVQHDVFNTVLDLFFSFPWNNFLHTQVEQCLHVMLDVEVLPTLQPVAPNQPPDSTNQTLHEYLFGRCRILERLLDGYNNNENIVASGGRRQGYMGHLTHMVNSIRKWYEERATLKELVQSSTGEAVWSRWCDFLLGPLAEVNRRNEMTIGAETNASSFDDGEEDFESPAFGTGNMLEKEYADYRNILLATPIEDDFGSDILDTHEEPLISLFNRPTAIMLETQADENKSDLLSHYEKACIAHIQQFDESHSDGEEEMEEMDPWPESNVGLNSTLDRNSSGVVFSSSEDDDDDSPFDGLHTQRTLKLSHRDSDEDDDKDGVEPRGTVHFTSPTSINDRAAAYMSSVPLGADSTTHQDLSSAGLERDEFLPWGDSDSESDDDTRGVVGLNAQFDWTKEADPDHKIDQPEEPAPTESFIEEVELVSATKGGSGLESHREEEAQDVDLASSDVKLLLNDSTEEEDHPVLLQETEATHQGEPLASSTVSEGGNAESKESQSPTSSTLDVEEGKQEAVSPSSVEQKQEPAQEADSTSSSAQEIPIANHKQEVAPLPSEAQEAMSSSSHVQEVTSSSKLQEVISSSVESEVQEVTLSLDGDPHLENDVDQPEDNFQDNSHTSNDRGVPTGEVLGAGTLANYSSDEGTPVDAEEVAVTSKVTEHHSEPPMMNGPASVLLDIGGGISLDFEGMEDMEEDLDDLDDNFSFLAKGLLSGRATVEVQDKELTTQSPEKLEMIERIRQEAQHACYQYEFETRANTK